MTLRCPECRSRRATYQSMQLHIKATGHKLCTCGGYHYAHRPGSPFCEQNPRCAYYHALRASEPDEVLLEILVDMAWSLPGKPLTKYNIAFL
jgi:hypothetical protein